MPQHIASHNDTDTDTADSATLEDSTQPYVFTLEDEAKLEGEDKEYREYHRVRMARASRILKDELTRRIDHILYTEWDPIGVHVLGEFDCFDEYHSYLPGIVRMLREDASLEALSDELLEIESFMLGPDTVRRRCDVIAVMVRQYGPHAEKCPFVVTINTDTPQAAYQSVLALLTQTRLDAYEKRWDAVCQGYEKAVEICRAFLPRRDVLTGACLNNLAQACTLTGRLDQARAALEEAACRLKPRDYKTARSYVTSWNRRLYEGCLHNLINHLEYRGERRAAVRYARALVAHSVRSHGKRFSHDSHEARDRLRRLLLREQVPARLGCSRISVEQDGCGAIGNTVLID